MQGYLYQLEDHLDRLYTSAAKAAIVPPFPRTQLRRIILDTAAASQRFDGVYLDGAFIPHGYPPTLCLHPSCDGPRACSTVCALRLYRDNTHFPQRGAV